MCDQCTTEALRYGAEVLPGFWLMRAQKEGIQWPAGHWGLVECNDPTVTWQSEPQPSPVYGMTDDEEEAWFKKHEGNDELLNSAMGYIPDDFRDAFRVHPNTGYKLVMAAEQRGYNHKTSGDLVHWLWEHLGEHLKTSAPVHHNEH